MSKRKHSRARRQNWEWRCTNPDCFLGGSFEKKADGRTHGVAWCVDCKGGQVPPKGMGKIYLE